MNKVYYIFVLLVITVSCQEITKSSKIVPPTREVLKGKKLYSLHCSGCHQKDGLGYKAVYPPLRNSDYLAQNFDRLACIIRFGLEGELVVNGQFYNAKMAAINGVDDYDIAAIINYLAFEYQMGDGNTMTRDRVKKVTSQCD